MYSEIPANLPEDVKQYILAERAKMEEMARRLAQSEEMARQREQVYEKKLHDMHEKLHKAQQTPESVAVEDYLTSPTLECARKGLNMALEEYVPENQSPGFFQFVGTPQKGKTSIILSCNIEGNKMGVLVINIVRNIIGDALQLKSRFDTMWENVQMAVPSLDDLQTLLVSDTKFEALLSKSLDANYTKKTRLPVIVCLANYYQLKKLLQALSACGDNVPDIALVIDENDSLPKPSRSAISARSKLDELCAMAKAEIGITATPMSVMKDREDLKIKNVMELELSTKYNYIGHSDIEYKILPDSDNHFFNKAVSFKEMVTDDKYLLRFIDDFPNSKASELGLDQPIIGLINNTHLQANHTALRDGVIEKLGDSVIVLVDNGRGIQVSINYTIYTKDTSGRSSGPKVTKVKAFEYVNARKFGISQVLQALKDQKETRNILIISGKKASRCLSVSSADYVWRLLYMFYRPKTNAKISDMVQETGRLNCCLLADRLKFHPVLYCTDDVCTEIQRGICLESELLERVKNYDNNEPMFQTMCKIPVRIEKVPSGYKIAANVSGRDFNRVAGNDGGRNIKDYSKYKKIELGVPPVSEGEDIDDSEIRESREQVGEEEYRRLTTVCFPKWSKVTETSKIAVFMQQLDPESMYTKDQLNLCWSGDAKLHIVNLQRSYNDNKGWGVILQSVNHKYRLHPCLLESFKKFFNYK